MGWRGTEESVMEDHTHGTGAEKVASALTPALFFTFSSGAGSIPKCRDPYLEEELEERKVRIPCRLRAHLKARRRGRDL